MMKPDLPTFNALAVWLQDRMIGVINHLSADRHFLQIYYLKVTCELIWRKEQALNLSENSICSQHLAQTCQALSESHH